jgi:hypothetical protein
MLRFHRSVTLLALLALAAPLSAQSTVLPGPSTQSANRVKVGLVLPLGNSGTHAENAPRFEAWSEHARRTEAAGNSLGSIRSTSSNRLGVSLAGQPQMLVNGREVPRQSGQHNVSAVGWAAITVGVLAAGLGLGLLGVFGRTE